MGTPRFWLVAGINGAGKTTLCQREPIRDLLGNVIFLNADDLTLSMLRDQGIGSFAEAPPSLLRETFIRAAVQTEALLDAKIRVGENIGVETVLSTDKYVRLIDAAKANGYFCGLVYIALRSPELAHARVMARVASGGHDVPADRIAERWHKSLDMMQTLWPRFDLAMAFDNSAPTEGVPPPLLAVGRSGHTTILDRTTAPQVTARFTTRTARQ